MRTFLCTWKIKNCNIMLGTHDPYNFKTPVKTSAKSLGCTKFYLRLSLQDVFEPIEVIIGWFQTDRNEEDNIHFEFQFSLMNLDGVAFESFTGTWSSIFFSNKYKKSKRSELERKILSWPEDTLTIQFLVKCESNLLFSESNANSVTGCEIITELHENSEFLWTFQVTDFQDWVESIKTKIGDMRIEVIFRYVRDKIKVAAILEEGYVCNFLCDIMLLDLTDNEGFSEKKPGTYVEVNKNHIHEFPFSFSKQELEKARCFLRKEMRFQVIFHHIFSTRPVSYFTNDLKINKKIQAASNETEILSSERQSSGYKQNECLLYLQHDLRNMLMDKKFTDIEIRAGDEKFFAHKNVLAARSPVFSAMFDLDLTESKSGNVDITDVDAKILKLFLDYLYTGSIDGMDEDDAMALLVVADKYQVAPLVKKCSVYLGSVLSLTNACKVLEAADLVNNDFLKSSSVEYIVDNSTKILKSPEWRQLLKINNTLATDVLIKVSENVDERSNKE